MALGIFQLLSSCKTNLLLALIVCHEGWLLKPLGRSQIEVPLNHLTMVICNPGSIRDEFGTIVAVDVTTFLADYHANFRLQCIKCEV
jgi:hypothetical protein